MPISASVIISQKINSSPVWQLNSHGCSEFPAHDAAIASYVSIGLAALNDSTVKSASAKLLGKEYDSMSHIAAWAEFITDMFLELIPESAENPFFSPYTLGEHRANLSKISGSGSLRLNETGLAGGGSGWGYSIQPTVMPDSAIIGLTTNAAAIRKHAGAAYYEKGSQKAGTIRCRKVQVGHTMFRLLWSTGWRIPILALKLKHISDVNRAGLSHLSCLWIAYKISMTLNRGYSDYGDIFVMDSGYASPKAIVSRFKDSKLNESVMNLFIEEQNPLATELGLEKTTMADQKITLMLFPEGFKSSTSANGILAVLSLVDAEMVARVAKFIDECHANLDLRYTQVKFKFSKPLFKSTATGVCYEGILKPNSKLNRILFRDEENSTLSVLRESKFIDVLK